MTRNPDENGWQSSAPAWIDRMKGQGDFSRAHVLDAPMMERVGLSGARTALDVGCGEGRFCRMMAARGIETTGLDPIPDMIAAARSQHGAGTYVTGFAEDLPFDDASFDLVVSYLSLIDIEDAGAAIAEMARVLRPGGRLLIANLAGFATAMNPEIRQVCPDTGYRLRHMRPYLDVVSDWFEWGGLRIRNWHRPLSHYMQWCLGAGLQLTHFDEPRAVGASKELTEKYEHFPYQMIMEWRKPG